MSPGLYLRALTQACLQALSTGGVLTRAVTTPGEPSLLGQLCAVHALVKAAEAAPPNLVFPAATRGPPSVGALVTLGAVGWSCSRSHRDAAGYAEGPLSAEGAVAAGLQATNF